MSAQLLEIQPRELKFIVELKKQSSCAVRLSNNTHYSVAFKVKTTSPKKYCVRPNVGIILAKSTCEFTVTMQAPKAVPVDLVCKDKFLIQSTVVPLGTIDKDITPNLFSKDDGKYIEEIKLRVALISPPESPVLSPISGVLKQGPLFEGPLLRDPVLSQVENTIPSPKATKNVEFKMPYNQESETEEDLELKPKKDVINVKGSKPAKHAELMRNNTMVNGEEVSLSKYEELKPESDAIYDKSAKAAEFPPPKNALDADMCPPNPLDADMCPPKVLKDAEFSPPNALDAEFSPPKELKDAEFSPPKALKESDIVTIKAVKELKFANDIEEMKSKLNILESKLNEAESTILKLTEERRLSIQERKILQEKIAMLSRTTSKKRVQVGFPLLFVVMVALVSILLGYLSHP